MLTDPMRHLFPHTLNGAVKDPRIIQLALKYAF